MSVHFYKEQRLPLFDFEEPPITSSTALPESNNEDEGEGSSASTEYDSGPKESTDLRSEDQRQGRSSKKSLRRFGVAANNLWLAEMTVWLLSVGCFVAIAALLAIYDGAVVDDWKHSITLNTMVAILAVVGAASLSAPISSSIGQAKWNWFRAKERHLADFQSIEGASRGPLGSMILLVKRRGGSVAALGSLLTILVLAISPFVQQIISLGLQQVITGAAYLPATVMYNGYTYPTGALDYTLQTAVYDGIFGSLDTAPMVKPACTTQNCTWPSFATLAVSNTCANVTNMLSCNGDLSGEYNCTLPGGLILQADPPHFLYLNIRTQDDPLRFKMNGSRVADVQVLFLAEDETVQALECMLQFRVKTYGMAKETSGVLIETELSSWVNDSNNTPASTGGNCTYADQCPGDWYFKPPGQDQKFYIDQNTIADMAGFLRDIFAGEYYTGDFGVSYGADGYNTLIQRFYDVTSASQPSFAALMDQVAQTMSVAIRSGSSATNITGTSHKTVVVFHISWPWLVFPLGLLSMTAALLLVVAVETRRRGLRPWKNSSTAVLAYGLDGELKEGLLEDNEDLDECENATHQVMVRLQRGSRAWVLGEERHDLDP